MADILVTGGAGFIGSHIVEGFRGAGHNVAVLDNLSSGSKQNIPSDVPLREFDIRSKEAHNVIRSGSFDLIIHAAAQMSVRVSMEDPLLDTSTNVVGIVNLLEASRRAKKLPRWLFLSTGGAIYGEQSYFPADENHPIRPNSLYGHSKRVGEMYLEFWKREFGLKYCVLRLANVYGPRQNPHGEAGVVAIFIEKLLRGEPPTINGDGEQTRDFVYVKDVARSLVSAYTRECQGIFNIGTSVETSVNALYHAISKVIGTTVQGRYAPAKAGEQMRSCVDPSAALKAFDWQPLVSLEKGLTLTAEWFRAKTA